MARSKAQPNRDAAAKPRHGVVNRDTLFYGATNVLGLTVPKNAQAQQIEKMILDLLRQDATFARLLCGQCQKPIVLGVTMCPYCTVALGGWPDAIQAMMEELSRQLTALQHPVAEEVTIEEVSEEREQLQAEATSSKNVEVPLAKRPLLPKQEKRNLKSKRGASKKDREAEKIRAELREQEKERRRQAIEAELPYTRYQLEGMKNTVLAMILGVLGVSNAVANTQPIEEILRIQADRYGTDADGYPLDSSGERIDPHS